jgi:ribosomal protein L11 methylase PrmA
MNYRVDPASFRDPSGFVFRGQDGRLYRQINRSYAEEYRRFVDGGLYAELVGAGLLVEHQDALLSCRMTDDACHVVVPREIGFVSYPFEWSFSGLKEAAQLTLEIARRALRCGMSLKDASAYNVQFDGGRPVFIDTLSFERYQEGKPWVAYGQFCRHFLAPLALMAKTDIRLHRLLSLYLDGVPLDLAVEMLPWGAVLRPGLLLHVRMHAWFVARHARKSQPENSPSANRPRLDRRGLERLIESLQRTTDGLTWTPGKTLWADYYASHSYSSESFEKKRRIVGEQLDLLKPRSVWDLGANTGVFSRLASQRGILTVAFDVDPACVEMNYQACRKEGERHLLPLCMDLANPSPAIGWDHSERRSLAERGPADLALALALIHHLAIGNNLPFDRILEFLQRIARHAIIEFVPKQDPQVQRLLRSRVDIFSDYHEGAFESAVTRRFSIQLRQPLEEGGRVMYVLKARNL